MPKNNNESATNQSFLGAVQISAGRRALGRQSASLDHLKAAGKEHLAKAAAVGTLLFLGAVSLGHGIADRTEFFREDGSTIGNADYKEQWQKMQQEGQTPLDLLLPPESEMPEVEPLPQPGTEPRHE